MSPPLLLIPLFIGLTVLESLLPLRKATQPKAGRFASNLLLSAIAVATQRLGPAFFTLMLAELTLLRGWGFLNGLGLEPQGTMRLILGLLLLDGTLYYWHRMNHKIRFFWRFHEVHHIDLDMDVSTAARFHFGELALSTLYRAAQILVIGVDPELLLLFETLITASALFHHSNLRLPRGFERILQTLIVTPRMHEVHHSVVQDETDSNYSAIFSIWDRLHRSMRLLPAHAELTIGVAAFRSARETRVLPSLVHPFQRPRPWKLPDGRVPRRLEAYQNTL